MSSHLAAGIYERGYTRGVKSRDSANEAKEGHWEKRGCPPWPLALCEEETIMLGAALGSVAQSVVLTLELMSSD